ncbi:ribosome biogenesis protein bop1-A-like [Saccostrea cucullata]|uniref:ribosome biogenesis protein bop1-A-like n=1 Tax=Saccostrea cuccullata TaxID=36930 RepID=UPI002ED2A4F3
MVLLKLYSFFIFLFQPWIDFFTHETMIHPVTNHPQHKRSFIPSKWEKLKVGQMVHALKMGWMKPTKPKTGEEEEQNYYMLWKDDEEPEITRRYRAHLPAPKAPLPGHAESYNPPPEYLLSKEEEEKWMNMEPEERRMNFLPQKYSSLRLVPAYKRFINERFERCLDLYLCPRKPKVKMNINPEDLIPKLPKPRDLQPFPTSQAIIFKGHNDIVRTISVDPTGQWLVSGSDDGTVRFWEVATGRCMKSVSMEKDNTGNSSCAKCVAWNPNPDVSLVAVAVGLSVLLINPGLGDKMVTINTDNIINSPPASEEDTTGKKLYVDWSVIDPSDKRYEKGIRFTLQHAKDVSQVTWHGRGDYFASVMPKGDSQSVLIHQLSRRRSQNPFTKSKGLVQCVLFHPIRPFLFVATQRYVRVYNLLKQELSKKLMTNCKWVSSMTVHSGGDNVIVGSYDCRLSWFDLDLSMKPYQTLRHHKQAVRAVNFHRKYPLFASASDDGTVIVCHGMVYNDLLKNPLIVPVKILKGHALSQGLGVLDCVFHPSQPWVFSCGADTTIRLFTWGRGKWACPANSRHPYRTTAVIYNYSDGDQRNYSLHSRRQTDSNSGVLVHVGKTVWNCMSSKLTEAVTELLKDKSGSSSINNCWYSGRYGSCLSANLSTEPTSHVVDFNNAVYPKQCVAQQVSTTKCISTAMSEVNKYGCESKVEENLGKLKSSTLSQEDLKGAYCRASVTAYSCILSVVKYCDVTGGPKIMDNLSMFNKVRTACSPYLPATTTPKSPESDIGGIGDLFPSDFNDDKRSNVNTSSAPSHSPPLRAGTATVICLVFLVFTFAMVY